jgi:hypothetical protein
MYQTPLRKQSTADVLALLDSSDDEDDGSQIDVVRQ